MSEKIIAKPLLKNKFWVLEKDGKQVATISVLDDQYMLSSDNGTHLFKNFSQIKKEFKFDVEKPINDNNEKECSVYGFPTKTTPYNITYDIKRKLPLFAKSDKSKSLFCAGYYIIKFDNGWLRSFCPKLVTIEQYESKGPFATEEEMKAELKKEIKNATG